MAGLQAILAPEYPVEAGDAYRYIGYLLNRRLRVLSAKAGDVGKSHY
jgi:hypothetical protein